MPASSWSPVPCCSPPCGCSSCATCPTARAFGPGPFSPTRSDLLDAFAPRAAQALAFLLVFGLVGGWLLAGRMLAPLTRITDATRRAASGSLSHRIELEGRQRRVPRARRQLRRHARPARGARRRAAAVRGQRLPRAAHPAGDHPDTPRRRPQGSEPRPGRARRPPPRRQRPGDRPHRGAAPAQPRRPAILHPRARRPVPAGRGGHRDAPAARREARRHHRDLRRHHPDRSGRPRSCCR